MADEVIYGRYRHMGPGPRWIAPNGSKRITPTFYEAQTLLKHWIKDRHDKCALDASSYKSIIVKEEEKEIEEWIMMQPQVQAMYNYASILKKIGFDPVVKIVIDENDEIQVYFE